MHLIPSGYEPRLDLHIDWHHATTFHLVRRVVPPKNFERTLSLFQVRRNA